MEPLKNGSSSQRKVNAAQHNDRYVTERSTWIDKKKVLDFMRIGERTLQKWRSTGLLPHYRIGGRIYYCEADLETLLEASKCTTTKQKKKSHIRKPRATTAKKTTKKMQVAASKKKQAAGPKKRQVAPKPKRGPKK